MSTKMTAKTPLDLIAFTPLAMGFTPTESVAMLTFGPTSFHARVDLGRTSDEHDAVAGSLLSPATQHGVTSVVFVLYTETDTDAARNQFGTLQDAFLGEGIKVIDGLLVNGGRWESLTSGEGGDADVSTHPFTVQGIADGRVTAPSRESKREMIAMRDTLPNESIPGPIDADSDLTSKHFALVDMIDTRAGGRFTDTELATLLTALDVDELRDTVTRYLARNYDTRGTEMAALFANAATRAPHEFRAHALATHAWAAYLSGDGAGAWISVEAVDAITSENSMAEIVRIMLTHATPPRIAAGALDQD